MYNLCLLLSYLLNIVNFVVYTTTKYQKLVRLLPGRALPGLGLLNFFMSLPELDVLLSAIMANRFLFIDLLRLYSIHVSWIVF